MQHGERGSVEDGAVLQEVAVRFRLQGLKGQLPQEAIGCDDEGGFAAQLLRRRLDQVAVERAGEFAIVEVAGGHLFAVALHVAQEGIFSGANLVDAQIGRRRAFRTAREREQVDAGVTDGVIQKGRVGIGQGGDQIADSRGVERDTLDLQLGVGGVEHGFEGAIPGARLLQFHTPLRDAFAVGIRALRFAQNLLVQAGQILGEYALLVTLFGGHCLGDAGVSGLQHFQQRTRLAALHVGQRGLGTLAIQLKLDHVQVDGGLVIHEADHALAVAGELLAELFGKQDGFLERSFGLVGLLLIAQAHAEQIEGCDQRLPFTGLPGIGGSGAGQLFGVRIPAFAVGDLSQENAGVVGVEGIGDAPGEFDGFLELLFGGGDTVGFGRGGCRGCTVRGPGSASGRAGW